MAREKLPPSPLATQVAFRFVQGWASGVRPSIEESLSSVPPSQRPSLFESLLIVEINTRRKLGERPTTTEYSIRFPQFQTTVTNTFESIAPVPSQVPKPLAGQSPKIAVSPVAPIVEAFPHVVPIAPLPAGVQVMPIAMPFHPMETRPNAFEFVDLPDSPAAPEPIFEDRRSRKLAWLIGLSFVGIVGVGVAASVSYLPNFRKQAEEPVAEATEKPSVESAKTPAIVVETRDIDMGGPKTGGDPEQNIVDWIREIGGSGYVLTEQGGRVRYITGQNMPKTGKFTIDQITLGSSSSAKWNNRSLARLADLKNLRKLDLYRDTELSDETLAPLVQGSKLKHLELRGSKLQVTGEGLAKFTNLESLVVNTSPTFGDADCEAITKLANLQSLELNSTKISPAGFGHISKMPNLKSLTFGSDQTLTPDHIRRLQAAPIEEIRSLGGLTDDIFREFAVFPNIKRYTIQKSAITSAGFKTVAGQVKLEELAIVGSMINGEGLEHLANLEKLVSLDLSGAKIEGDVLGSISKLPNLKSLRLSGNGLGDKEVVKLFEIENLESLDLSRTKITNATLIAFKKHPTLKRLIVKGTSVTATAIREFSAATPECIVEN